MKYWLVKSEPFKYSWEQFVQDGKTFWDGVRNYGARNNLKAMKRGDPVLFYHSNDGLAIVGIAEVLKEAYQDPTTVDSNWVAVDMKPIKAIRPVTSPSQSRANVARYGSCQALSFVGRHGEGMGIQENFVNGWTQSQQVRRCVS
jgi:hypothetical protein